MKRIIEEIKSIFLQRYILKDMAIKEFKAKYSGSILGFAWAIIIPLLIMAVISFVFGVVLGVGTERFPLFVLSGILPWMFFAASLQDATFSILNQRHLLRKFTFSAEILPLASILADLLNFLLGWIVIVPVFLFFKPQAICLLPLLGAVLFLHLVFIFGIGMAFSILNISFRDLGQLMGVILMFWFWVTPIFYSVEMVPPAYRWICDLNPLTPYIVSYRNILFAANSPELYTLLKGATWSFFSLFIGLSIFIKLKPGLAKRI